MKKRVHFPEERNAFERQLQNQQFRGSLQWRPAVSVLNTDFFQTNTITSDYCTTCTCTWKRFFPRYWNIIVE